MKKSNEGIIEMHLINQQEKDMSNEVLPRIIESISIKI